MINDADILDWIGEYEPTKGAYMPETPPKPQPLTDRERENIRRANDMNARFLLKDDRCTKKDNHEGEVKVCGEWFKLNEEVDWTIVHYMGSYQICSYKVRFIKLDGTVMGKFDDGEIIPADSMITWVTYTENEFGWWEKYSEHKSVAKVKDFLRKVGEA